MKQEVVTVGLDLAKSVFQVHAIGGGGAVLMRRKLRLSDVIGFFTDLPACLVGMEACGSAHDWAWELIALGHEVRLMPPAYGKPDVKCGKTDAAHAEAICEAVTRPTMRFVAMKAVEQQAILMLHKSRDLLVRQRTMLINALRGHLAEYVIVTGVGAGGVTAMLKALQDQEEHLPVHARSALHGRLKTQILTWHRADATNRRLATISGIGTITASAISAAVPDASLFRSGRQFTAWLGIPPRANSSSDKERLGGITNQGDGYLRRVLVVGATAVMRVARKNAARQPWMAQLLERKPAKIATVVLANKTVRIAWAMMSRNEVYAAAA
jgi:transposase